MPSNKLPYPASSPGSYASVFSDDTDWEDYSDYDLTIARSGISFRRQAIRSSPSSSGGLTMALGRERETAEAKNNTHIAHNHGDGWFLPAEIMKELFSVGEESEPSDNDDSAGKQPTPPEVNKAADQKTSGTQEPTRVNRFLRSVKNQQHQRPKLTIPIPPRTIPTPTQQHSTPIPIPLTRYQTDCLKDQYNYHMDPHTGCVNEVQQLMRAGPLRLPGFDAAAYLERDADWVCAGCSTANHRAVFSCWSCKGSKGAWCDRVIPEIDGPVGFLVPAAC